MAWGQVSLGDALSRLLRNTSERFPEAERNAAAAESRLRSHLTTAWEFVKTTFATDGAATHA